MKILLLGAAGFIGTNLTIELAKKTEDEITLVDRSKAFFKPIVSILTEAIKPYGIPQGGVSQFTCGCTLSDSYSRPVFLVAEYDRTKAIKARLYEYRGDSSWEIASGVLRSFPSGIYRESTTNGMVKNSYDIPKVYKNIFDIGTDVALDIKVSKKLAFFGLRGGTFLEGNSKIANAILVHFFF